jgi:hypothetical protein
MPLLTVSRSFMNVTNSVLWRMAIILKANKVNLFVYSVLFFYWYHSPKDLDTSHINHLQLPPILTTYISCTILILASRSSMPLFLKRSRTSILSLRFCMHSSSRLS